MRSRPPSPGTCACHPLLAPPLLPPGLASLVLQASGRWPQTSPRAASRRSSAVRYLWAAWCLSTSLCKEIRGQSAGQRGKEGTHDDTHKGSMLGQWREGERDRKRTGLFKPRVQARLAQRARGHPPARRPAALGCLERSVPARPPVHRSRGSSAQRAGSAPRSCTGSSGQRGGRQEDQPQLRRSPTRPLEPPGAPGGRAAALDRAKTRSSRPAGRACAATPPGPWSYSAPRGPPASETAPRGRRSLGRRPRARRSGGTPRLRGC